MVPSCVVSRNSPVSQGTDVFCGAAHVRCMQARVDLASASPSTTALLSIHADGWAVAATHDAAAGRVCVGAPSKSGAPHCLPVPLGGSVVVAVAVSLHGTLSVSLNGIAAVEVVLPHTAVFGSPDALQVRETRVRSLWFRRPLVHRSWGACCR